MSSHNEHGEHDLREKLKRGQAQHAFCVAVIVDGNQELTELHELLDTAGVTVVGDLLQQRESPHPNTYLGKGKLDELKELLKKTEVDVVVCDDELTPRQERNLEQALGIPVIDRTTVILDIFAEHAKTAEGKLQVELAQLQYNLARMRGLWSHLERLGGGIGTRGPGETQIETDRRLARDRIAALKRKLQHVKASRQTMRKERDRSKLPTVALVGYTNAGKSTLLNCITAGEHVSVADQLFHTLDPTTRIAEFVDRRCLVTDTVGFIRKLPHQLVDAFSATLEETIFADVLIHVVDACALEEDMQRMVSAVDDVLEEIGATNQPRVLAFNKIDQLDLQTRQRFARRFPLATGVSAQTGEGVEDLKRSVAQLLRRELQHVRVRIPYAQGALLTKIYDQASGVERQETSEGVLVEADVPVALAKALQPFCI